MNMQNDDFIPRARFDEFLMLDDAATEAVVDLLTPVLDARRRRARKITDREAFKRTVGLVVANALAAGDRGVHYSRRPETYSRQSPYRPAWLGYRQLTGVIDRLTEEGLAWALEGHWGGPFATGVQSSFGPARQLTAMLSELGIEPNLVQRDRANAPVIVLRDDDDRLVRYYRDDERIIQQTAELRTYNSFIAAQDISLPGWDGPCCSSDLTRIYNDGRWDRGGRHFGGWWQPVPSDERTKILINGEQTTELDYGGFFPRALYHLTGQDLRGDDPYNIPEIRNLIDRHGIEWTSGGRRSVKTMVNIAISAKSKNAFFSADSIKEINLPEHLIRESIPLIFEHHNPIKEHLLKGKALEIMNLESNICQEIICRGMEDGVVILPVFDSFITSIDKLDYLANLMIEEYEKLVGYRPTIH